MHATTMELGSAATTQAAPRSRRTLYAVLAMFAIALVAISAYSYRPDIAAATIEARYATHDSHFIAVGGVRVHYVDVGHGSPLVLLHGSNASLFDWEGWTTTLRDRFRVIALDLPGHGLTGPDPQRRYTYVEQARFVSDFLDTIGVSRFAVAGNSMGGSIAWHLALMHPTRVTKLILLDSVGLPRDEPRPMMFRAYTWPVVDHLLTVFTPRESVAMALKDAFGDPGRVSDAEVDRTWALLRREGNREATRVRLQQQGDSDDWVKRLGTLRVPTLVVWGGSDDWVLPKYGRRFVRLIPHAQLITYPGVGHLPMLEIPKRSARDARSFLLDSRLP
jgi:pimeloyl-ACP methyl ester carboxylesterase